jgi:ketosteroid isomerase-like protein
MHDAKAMAALVTEDYKSWDDTVKGRAALEKNMTELFEGQHIHVKQLEEIGIIFVTPDVAIYKQRTVWTGWVDEDGKPTPPVKQLTANVYVKQSGKWLEAAWFSRDIEE